MYRRYYNQPRRQPGSSRYNYENRYRPRPVCNYYSPYRYYYGRRNSPRERPYWHADYERLLARLRRYRRPEDPVVEPSKPEVKPKPEPPKEELAKALQVKKIDYHILENTKKHRTHKFECTKERKDRVTKEKLPAKLVVRRGQKMTLTITFDQPYENKKYDASIVFKKGPNPLPPKGTMYAVEVDETGKKTYEDGEWGASIVSKDNKKNSITVEVSIPGDCIIGPWNLEVETYIDGGKDEEDVKKRMTFAYSDDDDDLIILFNPWSKDDTVYMPTKTNLDEYILNDNGCYFWGSRGSVGCTPWIFGQFFEGILEAALCLLRLGFDNRETKGMADAVTVSRIVTKMINSADDKGVLQGNWSGDYTGGAKPMSWKGSVNILRKWMAQDNEPVKFGQCWVFSNLVTTVCRALGIPSRCVTNFDSAHDTDENNAVELYFEMVNGKIERAKGYTGDSIWNFHCWNEVWLARPDIEESGFDGWQVIDATPQESSGGVYQCGPAPKAAIKRGLCDKKYDTSFIVAEVNADQIHYLITPGRRGAEFMRFDRDRVGGDISTKRPDGKSVTRGFSPRLDITNEYKFPEGSEEERKAVKMSQKTAKFPSKAYEIDLSKLEAVKCEIRTDPNVTVGKPIALRVICTNEGTVSRAVKQVQLTIAPQTYTGEMGDPIYDEDLGGRYLKPKEEKTYEVKLEASDYVQKITGETLTFNIHVTWCVRKTDDRPQQIDMISTVFRLKRPDLQIEAAETARIDVPERMIVRFVNPLPVPLTQCTLSHECTGFTDLLAHPYDDVGPNEEFIAEAKTLPSMLGLQLVVFSFDCEELPDLTGFTNVTVLD